VIRHDKDQLLDLRDNAEDQTVRDLADTALSLLEISHTSGKRGLLYTTTPPDEEGKQDVTIKFIGETYSPQAMSMVGDLVASLMLDIVQPAHMSDVLIQHLEHVTAIIVDNLDEALGEEE